MSSERKAIVVLVVCLVGIGAGLLFLRGREAPAVVTRERLAGVQASLEDWTRSHGRLPNSLEELGLDDEAIRDHMGVVFEYTVGDDGKVTLTSYGADGKPGGFMFRADTSVTFEVDEDGQPSEGRPDAERVP